jgi:hypothetical protein
MNDARLEELTELLFSVTPKQLAKLEKRLAGRYSTLPFRLINNEAFFALVEKNYELMEDYEALENQRNALINQFTQELENNFFNRGQSDSAQLRRKQTIIDQLKEKLKERPKTGGRPNQCAERDEVMYNMRLKGKSLKAIAKAIKEDLRFGDTLTSGAVSTAISRYRKAVGRKNIT